MAARVAIHVRSCRNAGQYLNCKEDDVSVHTGLLLALRDVQTCRLTEALYVLYFLGCVKGDKRCAG